MTAVKPYKTCSAYTYYLLGSLFLLFESTNSSTVDIPTVRHLANYTRILYITWPKYVCTVTS